MALFVLTYDQRATHHNYSNLYALLNSWGAAHLQNSVWLADMASGTAQTILEAMRAHMHTDDTICVIQLPNPGAVQWWSTHCRPEGVSWLKARYP
jgi:CRISPR/Cas system-associated endoribonuclease Cas2